MGHSFRSTRERWSFLLLAASVLTGASLARSVRARPSDAPETAISSADKALAAALFREGKSLMDRDDFAAACPKLEESQRLDPGGGTLLNLALCHEQAGRAATAWAEFIEALGIAKRDHRAARVQFAEEHIRALEPSLSRMTLVVPPQADEPELELRADGAIVGRAAWSMAFPVDAGEHTVQASAPDKVPWHTTVLVGVRGQANTVTVQVPPLARADVAAPSRVARQGEGGSAASPSPLGLQSGAQGRARAQASAGVRSEPSDEPQPSGARRAWGFTTLAVGAAGIGVGSVLGGIALSKRNRSNGRCPRDPCDKEAVDLSQSAGRAADWATVTFAVGLTSAAIGTYLLLSGRASDKPSRAETSRHLEWTIQPSPRAGGASLGVAGRFF